MESSSPARVLVVAHKTAATPALIAAVRERAARGPATFTLLVPNAAHGLHKVVDAEDMDQNEAEQILELAIPLLEEAAGGPVEGIVGDPTPLDAVAAALGAAEAVFPERRESSRQRQSIIAATLELQERDLMKLEALSAALAGALLVSLARRADALREPSAAQTWRTSHRCRNRPATTPRRERSFSVATTTACSSPSESDSSSTASSRSIAARSAPRPGTSTESQ